LPLRDLKCFILWSSGARKMSEEDDAEYGRRIREVLEERGFGWVVAQAEAQIAAGKPSSKQVYERELFRVSEETDFAIRRPRSRRASLITSEPYTESERLGILLHAVEAALVQRSALEIATLEEVHGIDSIRFEPEEAAEAVDASYLGRPHEITASRRVTALEIVTETEAALQRIRSPNRDRA
jgi:hypothetical protein